MNEVALKINNVKTEKSVTNENTNYFPEDWNGDYDLPHELDELDFYEPGVNIFPKNENPFPCTSRNW